MIVYGILLPDPDLNPSVIDTWLDLDANGFPARTPLIACHQTVLIERHTLWAKGIKAVPALERLFPRLKGPRGKVYSRTKGRFLPQEGSGTDWTAHGGKLRVFAHARRNGERHPPLFGALVVARADQRPFGYIDLHSEGRTTFKIGSSAASAADAISLAWLDCAAKVETTGRSEPAGLAQWALGPLERFELHVSDEDFEGVFPRRCVVFWSPGGEERQTAEDRETFYLGPLWVEFRSNEEA